MSSELQEIKLSEIAHINPKRIIARGTKAPFIDMASIPTNSRDIENIPQQRVFKGSGSRFMNGDTLLARITPCLENGKTALVNNLTNNTVGHGSTEFIVLSSKDKEDQKFIYYLVRGEAFRSYAIARMEGTSGRQRVPTDAVAEYTFYCPPKNIRAEIGNLLGLLDDRITLLRETNKTLEAIAQAIFKSWFVDFDPVHAKAEGRAPEGMDEETAALFPDEFEKSELGLVPKGWKHSTVGELFILTMGQSPSSKTYNQIGEGLPFYQGRTDFGFRFPSQRIFCNAPTRIAEKDDTLVSVRAPVGDVNMAIEQCCIGRGVASVRHPKGCKSFVYYTLSNLGKSFKTYNSEGTVFGSISKKDFEALSVVQPSKPTLLFFENSISALDSRILNNEESIRVLTDLRDTLLPRLISGKLRLPEAESLVEEVI